MKELRSVRIGDKVYVFDTSGIETAAHNTALVAYFASMIALRYYLTIERVRRFRR